MNESGLFGILALLFLASCSSGYQQENGQWVWVSYDESAGKRVTYIDAHDNEDELMAGTKSGILLSHFIELNPEYKWLDTLEIGRVIVGEWGTGKTKSRKFKGFKSVEE